MKAVYARSSRGDFDGLLALFDPRVEWVEDPPSQARSPAEVTPRSSGISRSMPREWEELRVELERFVDYGDEFSPSLW